MPGPLTPALTKKLQAALTELAADDAAWRKAKRDPAAAMKALGISIPKKLVLTFFDVERREGQLAYIGQQRNPALVVARPPGRRVCTRVVRVCERRFVITQEPGSATYRAGWQTNCYELCADPRFYARPWPPVPS